MELSRSGVQMALKLSHRLGTDSAGSLVIVTSCGGNAGHRAFYVGVGSRFQFLCGGGDFCFV